MPTDRSIANRWLPAGAAMLVSLAAFAHHSPAAYDITKEVVVEGTIVDVAWNNPHIYFTIAAANAGGAPVLQQVEAASISQAQTFGLRREHVAPGSHVVVRARTSRRGPGHTVLGAELTTADGRTYALTGLGAERVASRPTGEAPAGARASSLAGKWAPAADPLLLPTVLAWPFTDRARAERAGVQTAASGSTSCSGAPLPMLTQVPTLRTIEVRDDAVVIRFDAEGVDSVRTIRLDMDAHPKDVEPSPLGHSIGRWQGATLVIDTVGFAPHGTGLGFGFPSGPGKHMIERFTLADDGLELLYDFTIEDPDYLSAPASYRASWIYRPDLELSSEPCDPDIARRFLAD